MWRRPIKRALPNLTFLSVLAILGCTGSRSSAIAPVKKGVNSTGKPCPPADSQKLAEDALQLVGPSADPVLEGEKSAALFRTIRNGGYVTVGFWGIPTEMDAFKSLGNERGFVDVLNIPYCTQVDSYKTDGDLWLNRCLSFKTKYELGLVPKQGKGSDNNLDKEFAKNGTANKAQFTRILKQPVEVSKVCTAHFSMDADDTKSRLEQRRVRVWTAEHCYQPAYSTRVTAYVWVVPEKLNSNQGAYVPIVLDQLDGVAWREKVLAVGGGKGNAKDPKLADKILILRSTDGRSSDVYQKTFDKYCVGGSDLAGLPKFETGQFARVADCFSVSDVSTFKGTVNVSSSTQRVNQNLGGSRVEKSDAARKSALNYLLSDSIASANTDLDRNLADKFPPVIGRQMTVSKFITSIFDGLQYARRKRAFAQELSEVGRTDAKQLERTLEPFRDVFSMPMVDYSKNEFSNLISSLENVLPTPVASLCSLVGADCGKREFGPLDTRWMEDIALGNPPPGFDEFLTQRVNVFIAKLINNRFVSENHPLHVNALDSQFLSNLKVTSFYLKLLWDVVLLHKQPLAGEFATVLQTLVKNSCGRTGLSSGLFPVMGNFSVGDPKVEESLTSSAQFKNKSYVRVAPLGAGTKLSYIPIGMSNTKDYEESPCHSWRGPQLGLGVPMMMPGISDSVLVPKEAVYALHGNDSALSSLTPEEMQNSELVEDRLVDYLSSRVMLKFFGEKGNSFFSASPGDSGAMASFMGFPIFMLSAHNWNPVNGIVLSEPPDLNDPDATGSSRGGAGQGSCK